MFVIIWVTLRSQEIILGEGKGNSEIVSIIGRCGGRAGSK